MPTPNSPPPDASSNHSPVESHLPWIAHATCPPMGRRLNPFRTLRAEEAAGSVVVGDAAHPRAPMRPGERELKPMDSYPNPVEVDEEVCGGEMLSPVSVMSDAKDPEPRFGSSGSSGPSGGGGSSSTMAHSPGPSRSFEFSHMRFQPTFSSSFLRAGSKFHGTQQSDLQVYDVQVELKHVDMDQSFLCGYLRIQGLTPANPTLTTYFEGEIIGDKYSFQTKHPDWGSNDKVDMQHWARFHAWRPLAKSAKKPDFAHKNFAQRENIFMRWKEHFLVPDHRLRTIPGASFEGFYYICFNQISGNVSGIYFHAKSEKYQQLELTHVDDRGCFGAMEFR